MLTRQNRTPALLLLHSHNPLCTHAPVCMRTRSILYAYNVYEHTCLRAWGSPAQAVLADLVFVEDSFVFKAANQLCVRTVCMCVCAQVCVCVCVYICVWGMHTCKNIGG